MHAELPSLHALHCFEAAAKVESVTLAARELHLTHGAISRQIRLLEAELGVSLFVRRNRRVVLTAEGLALFAAVRRGLDGIRESVAELRRARTGALVVSCEPTLTLHWLIPRLGVLHERHPDLVIHLESSGGLVDFERTGIDVAIRRDDFTWPPDVLRESLMDEWLGPVCTPAYAREWQARRTARAVTLHTRTRPRAWLDWSNAAGRTVGVSREIVFDHFAMSIQAAVSGLGMAIGPYPLVREALTAGRLIAPFGFVRGDVGYVLASRRPLADDPRTMQLREWLTKEKARLVPKRALRRGV